jgi:transposase
MQKSQLTIGLDLGDRRSHVCVLDEHGAVVTRTDIATTPAGMTRFFEGYAGAIVVMEAGTHSRWVSALLQRLQLRTLVADVRQVRLIYAGTHKSDVLDAEKLARLARVDQCLLHPIQHRGEQAQADLAVVKARDVLVAARKDLINHARAAVKGMGERLPSCDADSFARKARDHVPELLKPALGHLLSALEEMTAKIRDIERVIEKMAEVAYPETARLTQVPGVGPITALTFILTIEDNTRFKDARSVGAFLGLVPRRDQSGERDPRLGITKAGNSYLRRLLVNCAHYITGPFGPDCDLLRFARRICPAKDRARKKRAVVAVARKLSVLLYRLWQTGEKYVPLRLAA